MKILDFILRNTVSPNGQFFYEIQKPKELNKSAFGCKIAIYKAAHELIYFHENSFAHQLKDPLEMKEERLLLDQKRYSEIPLHRKCRIASWSKQGNMICILEYQKIDLVSKYEWVFINMQSQTCYRVKFDSLTDEIISEMGVCKESFDEEKVKTMLGGLELNQEHTLFKDEIDTGLFSKKWYR